MPHDMAPADGPPPRDFRTLRQLIVERRDGLPRRLLQAADFAVSHPQELAFGRVGDVARQAGVQPSAMIRFAQALGYRGFSDLQAVFLAHARERWPDYQERVAALDAGTERKSADLLRGFMQAAVASVERLDDTIDRAALQRAVAVLAAAETIHLMGTRRSFAVTAYLTYALRRLGVRCEPVEQPGGLGPEQAALLDPRDAALAVSFTPYAPQTLELAAAAAARGVPVVAITDSPFSPLVRLATVWLEVADADHAGFRSLAGTLTVAATLAVAIAARRGRVTDPEKME